MFSLWGKIRLDGAEAKKDAAKVGLSTGMDVSKGFMMALSRYVSAGAITAMFLKAVRESEDIIRESAVSGATVEGYQELAKGAKGLGISIKELQELGKQRPEQFAAYMEQVRGKVTPLDERTVGEMNKTGQEIEQVSAETSELFGKFMQSARELKAYTYGYGLSLFGGTPEERAVGRQMMLNEFTGKPQVSLAPAESKYNETLKALLEESRQLRLQEDKNAKELKETLTQ